MLIVMSGLPGTGKSAVAAGLARALPASILSVDPIEAAILRAGVGPEQPTGLAAYVVADVLAEENLRLGLPIIIDAVNAVEPARDQWRDLARRADVALRLIQTICSDEALHRRRLAARRRNTPEVPEPTWESVQARRVGFLGWADDRLVLDSVNPLAGNIIQALDYLGRMPD